jgi:hypothetical protein
MENNFCNSLTLNGYEIGKTFDASVFKNERIDVIRFVIRHFFRKRISQNYEYDSKELTAIMNDYLGGSRRCSGPVHSDIREGEFIYAMILEGFWVMRSMQNTAHFNVSSVDYRALLVESMFDPSKLRFPSPCKVLERIDEIDQYRKGRYIVLNDGRIRRTRLKGDYYTPWVDLRDSSEKEVSEASGSFVAQSTESKADRETDMLEPELLFPLDDITENEPEKPEKKFKMKKYPKCAGQQY